MTTKKTFSIITFALQKYVVKISYVKRSSEKYSRGRRGAPAKGVGRATGARVQIPLSPLFKKIKNFLKKLLTSKKTSDILRKLSRDDGEH